MKIRLSSIRQIRFGLNRNIESIGCIMPRFLQAISSLTTEIWLLKTDVVTESVAFGTITIYVNDSFDECRSDSNSCKSVTPCFCNTRIAFPDSPIEEDVTLSILRQHQHTIKSIDPSHIVLIGIICNFIVPYTRVRA